MKLDVNHTTGSRYTSLGSPASYLSSGSIVYQPQYSQQSALPQSQVQPQVQIESQSQASAQPQRYIMGVEPQSVYTLGQPTPIIRTIAGAPYRTSSHYSQYSGTSNGVIEQMAPIHDDDYSSAKSSAYGSATGRLVSAWSWIPMEIIDTPDFLFKCYIP